MPLAIIGLGLSAVGLFTSMSAADDASALRRQEQAKAAKLAFERLKIAVEIQNRADAVHCIWASYYVPHENATIAEICSEPVEVANLAIVSRRARGEVGKLFSEAKRQAIYCIPPQQTGQRIETQLVLDMRRADTTASVVRAAVKAENARVLMVNAQRLNDKMNIINPGRGHAASTTSALQAAAQSYEALSKETDRQIVDASRVLGRAVASAWSTGNELLKQAKPLAESYIQRQNTIRTEKLVDLSILDDQREDQNAFAQTQPIFIYGDEGE